MKTTDQQQAIIKITVHQIFEEGREWEVTSLDQDFENFSYPVFFKANDGSLIDADDAEELREKLAENAK